MLFSRIAALFCTFAAISAPAKGRVHPRTRKARSDSLAAGVRLPSCLPSAALPAWTAPRALFRRGRARGRRADAPPGGAWDRLAYPLLAVRRVSLPLRDVGHDPEGGVRRLRRRAARATTLAFCCARPH